MTEIFASPFFGISLTVLTFFIGTWIQKKTKLVICNPLLIAIILTIGILQIFHIPYSSYQSGGSIINMFLSPATACLAVSIYSKRSILKENWLPIVVGCSVGSATSMLSIFFMCRLFHLDQQMTVSMLPKSVTTPIALSVSESLGGMPPVTVVAVILTGILGSILAPVLVKLFRISNPVEAGVAIGSCSHAIGTSKALELGEIQGAMSGLAIGVCGIVTVLFSLFLA